MPGESAATVDGSRCTQPTCNHVAVQRYRQLPPRSLWARLCLSGLGLLILALVLAVVVNYRESAVDASDLPISQWAHELGANSPALTQLSEVLREIGGGRTGNLIVMLAAVALIALRHWRAAVYLLLCSQGAYVISNIAKHTVDRPRPHWEGFMADVPGATSFPSGHTITGVATWAVLGVVMLFLLPRPWSTVAGWSSIAFGLMIAPSRMILGQHWFSDVIASWLLGFGWVLLISGLFLRLWGNDNQPDGDPAVQAQSVGSGP